MSRAVRHLMGSIRATPVVLGFIVVTQPGQRAQRQEEEVKELERKRDDVWGLDENKLEVDESEDT